jgi:hypothetical protein
MIPPTPHRPPRSGPSQSTGPWLRPSPVARSAPAPLGRSLARPRRPSPVARPTDYRGPGPSSHPSPVTVTRRLPAADSPASLPSSVPQIPPKLLSLPPPVHFLPLPSPLNPLFSLSLSGLCLLSSAVKPIPSRVLRYCPSEGPLDFIASSSPSSWIPPTSAPC